MEKDPLSITISLLLNLNLVEDGKDYNINRIKELRNLDYHWVTLKKYLKIIELIQKYAPEIKLNNSKVNIKNSKILKNLTMKERFALYLFNNHALNAKTAVKIPIEFSNEEIDESVGFFYEKIDNKYYLNGAGIELYNSIQLNVSDLIFNEKEIDEIFGNEENEEIEQINYPHIPEMIAVNCANNLDRDSSILQQNNHIYCKRMAPMLINSTIDKIKHQIATDKIKYKITTDKRAKKLQLSLYKIFEHKVLDILDDEFLNKHKECHLLLKEIKKLTSDEEGKSFEKLDLNDKLLWLCVGIILKHFLKDYRNAIAHYKEALNIDPKFNKALIYMAETYEEQKNYKKASESYKKVIENEPVISCDLF